MLNVSWVVKILREVSLGSADIKKSSVSVAIEKKNHAFHSYSYALTGTGSHVPK